MNFVLKVTLLLLGVLAFVVLIVWGYVTYWFATKQLDREIASGLNIGSDWVEIVPQPPLRIQKHVQYLILFMDGNHQRSVDTPRGLRLPGGTLIDPEVQIVDENGDVRRMGPSSLMFDSGVGYKADFRKDQVLTRVRIRSEIPFCCSKVIWHCFRMK